MMSNDKKTFPVWFALVVSCAISLAGTVAFGDGGSSSYWESLNAEARRKTHRTIRPGEPGVRPAWNANAKVFQFAPAFDFKDVPGARSASFSLVDEGGALVTNWTAKKPWSPVPAAIWDSLPCGYYTARVEGAGERTFYRAAVFEGPYPSSDGGYRAAARRCYRAVTELPYVRSWLEKPEPSPDYDLNCYPSKILGSVITVLVRDGSTNSIEIARRMADWLIAQSEKPGAPLAHFPPTYWGTARPEPTKFAGCVMLHYPARVANALFDLAVATGERRYQEQAIAIARTYLKLQGEDGSWPLMMRTKDGSEYRPNRLNPSRWVVETLERAGKATGEAAFAGAVARAVGFYEKGPLVTWNWEAQFEDQDPPPPYANLTKQFAMECACRFYAQGRIAEAEELKDWCEDQFTVWGPPLHIFNWTTWRIPCALEQYNCYMPIDGSIADMIHLFLAAYRATGSNLDYEKAKALADGVLRYQRKDGTIPTYFFENRWENGQSASDWVNCMSYTSTVLEEFAPLAEAKAELERFVGAGEAARVRIIQTDDVWPDDESFRITAKDGGITLTGGARGILWGVYELLEKYAGVEFLATDYVHVPKNARLAVPEGTDDFQKPAFESREEYWFPVMWHPAPRLFARRLRLNDDTAAKWSKKLWKCHTFLKLVPLEKYAESHPEYYSEVKGRRLTKPGEHPQLCLSNPEVADVAAESLKAVIREEPWAKYFSISQMDWKNYCECARCRAIQDEEGGVVSGPIVRFMNEIADRIADEFPDKKVSTLSYNGTFDPPKTKLRPNASVIYAESTRDFGNAFGRGRNPRNHAAIRELAGWGKLTDDIHVWDYTADFGSYMTPHPDVRTFARNLRIYRDSHVRHAFMQGAWQGNLASLGMMKTWVLAKLMWNPDQDVDSLVRRYMLAYYGPAAAPMFEYYRLLHDLPARYPEFSLCSFWDENIQVLDEGFRARANELIAEAGRLVRDDPVLSEHVRDEAYCLTFGRLMRFVRPLNVSRECRRLAEDGTIRAWVKEIDAMLKLRKPVALSENGVTRARYERQLETLRKGDPKVADDLTAVAEESAVRHLRPGEWSVVTNDAAASGGKAVRIFNTHTMWCEQQRVSEILCWDPGRTCRFRVKARADLVAGADPEDPVLVCGVYDHTHRKAVAQKVLRVKDFASDGAYAWFELFDFKPDLWQVFWVAPGGDGKSGARAFSSVWIDQYGVSEL